MHYSHTKTIDRQFDEVVEDTKHALEAEGFGVITEIDVRATFKKKIGKDWDNYVILGACNPHFAYAVLRSEKEIGLFLPCNVIVYEDGGRVFVSTILPTVAMQTTGNDSMASVAREVEEKLVNAIDRIA